MKYYATFFVLAFFLASCASIQGTKTLGQLKEDLVCIKYEKGIPWKQFPEKFGNPDDAPIPEPGKGLGSNARAYRKTILILYTENQEIKEGEKIRFHEVVNDIEVCKRK
jgi:hypothetical protein